MLEKKLKRKIEVIVSEWRFFRYPCAKRMLMADSYGENHTCLQCWTLFLLESSTFLLTEVI